MGILGTTGCGSSDEPIQQDSAKAGSSDNPGQRDEAIAKGEPDSAPIWTGLKDPLSGSIPERTRYIPAVAQPLDPPLRKAWSLATDSSVEIPIVANGVAYLVDAQGTIRAVRFRDHKTLWERASYPGKSSRSVEAFAPTYTNGRILVTFSDGEMAEIDAATGRPIRNYEFHTHLDSPPLVFARKVYLIIEEINLVGVRVKTMQFAWEYSGLGPTNSGPSFHNGHTFVANTVGSIFSVNAGNGQLLWRTNTSKLPSLGKGGFNSSPAIAFGHVYAARDDGTVLALNEKTGSVAWSFRTRGDIDGAAAVAKVPGTPPSVYVGSSDGNLYALDGLSGKQQWRHDVGSPLSGDPIVIGDTVYVSSSTTGKTVGIDVHTHRQTFKLPGDGDTQIISDGRNLYAVSSSKLIGLKPQR